MATLMASDRTINKGFRIHKTINIKTKPNLEKFTLALSQT